MPSPPLVIEAALNGSTAKATNPNVPRSVGEIVTCALACVGDAVVERGDEVEVECGGGADVVWAQEGEGADGTARLLSGSDGLAVGGLQVRLVAVYARSSAEIKGGVAGTNHEGVDAVNAGA